jgi:arsenate reductase (glutaredoxin)
MKFHPKELVLIYEPKSDLSKKALAYAKSITEHVNEIDILNTPLTTTLWKEIINRLNKPPKEIMDRSSDYYDKNIRGREITMQGLLEILVHNPAILAGPIAIMGKKAVLIKTPTDILKVN